MFESEIELNDLLEGYRQEEASELLQITREQYVADQDAEARGTANPSVMNKPFWMFQVGPGGFPAWKARTTFGNIEEDSFANPVWCFTRFGATRTRLPDGRVVCIGGEHEDYYDPDFCIYNDVVVFDAPQKSDPPPLLTPESFKIYGYPVDIFPPTDFHTSTYFADSATRKESIIIIGGLGYADQPSRSRTEVYQLDLTDFSMQRLDTSGVGPSRGTDHHKAELVDEQGQAAIKITTEEVKELVDNGGGEHSTLTQEGEISSTTTASGERSTALIENRESANPDEDKGSMSAEKGTKSLSEEESDGSITALKDKKEFIRTKASKVFTLRIHDMTWI